MRPLALLMVLLASCAAGANNDDDGVIKPKGDARIDTRTADDDTGDDDTGSSPEEDTATESDSATTSDSGASDSGASDSATADTMTPPMDTGPEKCVSEEPEPNDTPATAQLLGSIDDCDGSGSSRSGVLSTTTDVDVFALNGSDTFGCSVNPYVKATGPVRVCMSAACKSGTTELKSCPKGTRTGSECCGTSEVEMEINCTGTASDDAGITITVRGNGSSLMCAAYSFSYHY